MTGVRLPRQARSRATFEAILAAARTLLETGGANAVTVQAVLETAGVGAGSFYQRFDGRDSLLRYLHDRFWAEAEEDWRGFLEPGAWRGATAAAVIGPFLRILVRWVSAHAGFLRAMLTHAVGTPDYAVLVRSAELENTLADLLIEVLGTHPDIRHSEPGTAIRVATLQAMATLRSRLIFLLPGDTDGISDEALAEELSRSFLGYLGLAAPPRGGGARLR